MACYIGDFTEDEALQQAIEYVGRHVVVHYLEDGKTRAENHGVILCITKHVVVVLCNGADIPLMFCRKTMQHVIPSADKLIYQDDLWLMGKPTDVTIN